jgi:hypothetical protein
MAREAELVGSMIKVQELDPTLLQGMFHLLAVLPALGGVCPNSFGAPRLFLDVNYFFFLNQGTILLA